MKLAIVHDDFMQWGGAERLVLAMANMWPGSPIFTSIYDEKVLPHDFPTERLRPSFLQKWPGINKMYRHLFFMYPLAFESFNLNEFDVVISSTTRFAKSIIVQPQTLHICYCNTPPKFLWMSKLYFAQKKFSPLLKLFYKLFLPFFLSYLRLSDFIAAQKVDYFVASSKNVAGRIGKYYRRESKVIYPFVDLERFEKKDTEYKIQDTGEGKQEAGNRQQGTGSSREGYFLIVSRLGGHKRVDLAIEAFNKLKLPLKVIGDGPERKVYEKMADSNINFLGKLSDEEVVHYYQNCTAFINPQLEDFGITVLEAQAAGKPVVAFGAGGVLETVVAGVTGEFFYPQTSECLIRVIRDFDPGRYDSFACRKQAEKFSRERFERELRDFVERKLKHYRENLV